METKTCTKCHLTKPLTEFYKGKNKSGYRSYCKLCCNAQSRANYEADPAKRIAQTNQYQRENRDKAREWNRRYREDNREKMREMSRASKRKHADRVRAYRQTPQSREAIRRCVQNKPDQYRATARQWRRNHPEYVAAKTQRRRSRILANGGNFTAQEWADLKAEYNYTCLCCGRKEPEITLTVDHVIPLSDDGSNAIINIQPLCGLCNSRKNAKTIDYRINFKREKEK